MLEKIRHPGTKYWCKYFVSIAHLSLADRREAGQWALERFTSNDVDLWTPMSSEPGFWFASERDVLLFTIRWSA